MGAVINIGPTSFDLCIAVGKRSGRRNSENVSLAISGERVYLLLCGTATFSQKMISEQC